MEVELVEEKNNVLLKRREVKFSVKYAGATPKREEVRNKLIALLDSDKKLTVLDYLKSDYGRQRAEGYVKVYVDAQAMKVEPSYKIKRNFPEKKAEPAEASGEPKKEGTKTEAKKEGE